ncbi:MAG: methyltransferase domain-containing protein [Chthoniobacterales bacterium]
MSASSSHAEAGRRVAARFPPGWLRHYVASKLRSDPVFPAACDLLLHSNEPLLDVGCGLGLLGFYLRERGFQQPILGVDTDGRKVARARAAAAHDHGVEFIEHDVRQPLPSFRGNVALLDLVHYLEPSSQRTLLANLAGCVPSAGALLLRDAPRDGSARFWMTYAGEVFAQTISWNLRVPLHFPTRETIYASFADHEFTREERPAWGATPFNNRLFIFRRRAFATAPAAESQSDSRARSGVAASVQDNAG